MSLTVDVVVVAYNHYELTESCMRHLAAQTREHRVYVVDNGSTDGTPQRVGRDFPHAEVIAIPENIGFAAACNRGAAAGSGDVVVLMNNDVDCEPACIEHLARPLEADASLGSVAALSVKPGGERIDSVGMCTDVTLAAFLRFHDEPVERATETRPVLMGPAGAIAAYRRSAWESLGGLEERLYAYMEDFDLGLRLRHAGWGTTLATDAVGVHIGSATFGHRSPRQRSLGAFARGFMLRRYGLFRSRAALRTLVTELLAVVGDAVLARDLLLLKGRIRGWRAAKGTPRLPLPGADVIDRGITFRVSLELRRGIYRRPPA